MNKIFKYRPLSDFLFKELLYQEIYFASYDELNDPQDLSAKIEFTSKERESIEYLIWFIFKTQFEFDEFHKTNKNYLKFLKFNKNEKAQNLLIDEIFKNVNKVLEKQEKLWTHDIIEIINESIEKTETDIVFNSHKFQTELERVTNKFLKNSYVTCFSKTNNEFLMWSHYASKHSGICLEFNIDSGVFPFESYHRNFDKTKVKGSKRIIEWDSKTSIRMSGNLKKVDYKNEQPYVNFYNFAPVFENEDDCDLLGLSKSWTHDYARELVWVFSTKTKSWEYEKEYRLIDINFDKPKIPEKRIRHFPIEALNAVYFGVNTPKKIRERIYVTLSKKYSEIRFFESRLNGTDLIEFSVWEYEEE